MSNMSRKLFITAALTFMLCLAGLVMSSTVLAQQCVDNENGTVTDNSTGLMWQKETARPATWDTAWSYASSLSLGGHSDWRLPSKYELLGLYQSPCKSLMEVVSDSYWSSTTYDYDTNCAWLVNFNYGLVSYDVKSYRSYVRAVRAGQ